MEPKVSSLDAEECLIAAMLLHDPDYKALSLVSDDDMFYEHLRPVLSVIRKLHNAGKPVGTVTVLYALEPILDSLSWRGDTGEVMLIELLNRRMLDPNCWSAPAMAGVIHSLALRRNGLQSAQKRASAIVRDALKPRKGWT